MRTCSAAIVVHRYEDGFLLNSQTRRRVSAEMRREPGATQTSHARGDAGGFMRGGWCAPHKAFSWTKATQHRPTDSLSSKGAPGHYSLPAHLCCADAPTLAAAHRSLHGRWPTTPCPQYTQCRCTPYTEAKVGADCLYLYLRYSSPSVPFSTVHLGVLELLCTFT